ncbi:hypothetical protein B0T24DRAFT_623247 [Lasiosphaeria ovina]|uniref:Uncharacterized protein n=1 Tax=Lasiosphaeria ovina TaxID=92902 RepID=A0AAE0KBB1_9PEZI|nr:hypothetical protein B0T24DRAFT_623247 [Lasiosphaeria ovina]
MVMQALDMARESPEAECDAKISALLNGALAEVVARLRAAPETYVMRRDEFSVFNFFQSRFDKRDELFMSARRRYWWFTTA